MKRAKGVALLATAGLLAGCGGVSEAGPEWGKTKYENGGRSLDSKDGNRHVVEICDENGNVTTIVGVDGKVLGRAVRYIGVTTDESPDAKQDCSDNGLDETDHRDFVPDESDFANLQSLAVSKMALVKEMVRRGIAILDASGSDQDYIPIIVATSSEQQNSSTATTPGMTT